MENYSYANLWNGCVGAWCPSQDRSRSTILTDFSGYNNHGTLTLMDPATDWVASQGKIALDFDGGNDFISVPNSSSISITGDITVSAFVKRNGSQINKGIAGHYNTGTSQRAWALFTPNDGLGNGIGFTAQSNGSSFNTNQVIVHSTDIGNEWVHLCGLLKAGTPCEIYVRGSRVGSAASATNSISAVTAPLEVGTYNQITANSFNGQLDDIRLYNRALTPSEIATLALRRGISYETNRIRRYFLPAAPPTGNLTKIKVAGTFRTVATKVKIGGTFVAAT